MVINEICVNAVRSLEMKLELEGSTTEGAAPGEVEASLSERMLALSVLGVKGILSRVIFCSHIWIREDFLG